MAARARPPQATWGSDVPCCGSPQPCGVGLTSFTMLLSTRTRRSGRHGDGMAPPRRGEKERAHQPWGESARTMIDEKPTTRQEPCRDGAMKLETPVVCRFRRHHTSDPRIAQAGPGGLDTDAHCLVQVGFRAGPGRAEPGVSPRSRALRRDSRGPWRRRALPGCARVRAAALRRWDRCHQTAGPAPAPDLHFRVAFLCRTRDTAGAGAATGWSCRHGEPGRTWAPPSGPHGTGRGPGRATPQATRAPRGTAAVAIELTGRLNADRHGGRDALRPV